MYSFGHASNVFGFRIWVWGRCLSPSRNRCQVRGGIWMAQPFACSQCAKLVLRFLPYFFCINGSYRKVHSTWELMDFEKLSSMCFENFMMWWKSFKKAIVFILALWKIAEHRNHTENWIYLHLLLYTVLFYFLVIWWQQERIVNQILDKYTESFFPSSEGFTLIIEIEKGKVKENIPWISHIFLCITHIFHICEEVLLSHSSLYEANFFS